MTIRPVMFKWQEVEVLDPDSGEARRVKAMVPHARFGNLCGRQFDLGEDYGLGPVDGVSSRSRAPLFIAVKEAWNNLPAEDKRFPTDEHLRKRALVEAGWADHSQTVFDTPKDAKLHALSIRRVDGYAVIKVGGCVVDCWTARSIASGAITGEKWRQVRTRALDWIAELVSTTARELEEHVAAGGSS